MRCAAYSMLARCHGLTWRYLFLSSLACLLACQLPFGDLVGAVSDKGEWLDENAVLGDGRVVLGQERERADEERFVLI